MYLRNRRTFLIVTSVLATLAIGAAFYYVRHVKNTEEDRLIPYATSTVDMRKLEQQDHVYGNPGASIVFVTYSDFLCPYCKEFHSTMKRVVETYGREGDVAWVFRHMPIVRLHPHAATYALASECVAQRAGHQGFWKFADLLYATVTPERVLTNAELVTIATQTGVSADDFTACMLDGSLMTRIEADFTDAIKAGASATPFTIIVTAYQEIRRQGSRPYPVVAATVEAMLRNVGALNTEEEQADTMRNFFDTLEDDTTGAQGTEVTPDDTL
ncbi:MAG: thioredoxin domain-containing protein [Candidatus Pacebacteria bacterium]|nr:thioredoxin domain-containing protein [Candidatus Paceibacterota bacterium]